MASIKELRFIFTSPTFIAEKEQFYIPPLNRERSLYGSEYEIKLRNELTQKSIARECADWIRKKVKFRSNITKENMGGFFNIVSDSSGYTYMPVNGLTTNDIGLEKGNNAYNMITRLENPAAQQFLNIFNTIWKDKNKLQDVTDEVLDIVENVYRENPPELIYFITIYSIFKDFLSDSMDNLPNEATGFKNSAIWNKLYDFQKDAALGVISKLERFKGQNLQDCDYVINYDIHWNPVRIIQRFGRIDRIGSPNGQIQLVNFWPDITLDDYINLKERVESRMKATVLTSTGDDDLLDTEEKGDLEYRKRQLEQLQYSILDMEDITGGLSITDLGLNEFRQDMLGIMKEFGDIELVPHGISAVVKATADCPTGVIFILRNVNEDVSQLSQNRLHPFYLIYMDMDGKPFISCLNPQKLLPTMRLLCKGKNQPDMRLCEELNRETRDGRNMRRYSRLLEAAIAAMMGAKEESDVDSLFRSGGTLNNPIHGLDEFELLCFLIVR